MAMIDDQGLLDSPRRRALAQIFKGMTIGDQLRSMHKALETLNAGGYVIGPDEMPIIYMFRDLSLEKGSPAHILAQREISLLGGFRSARERMRRHLNAVNAIAILTAAQPNDAAKALASLPKAEIRQSQRPILEIGLCI